MPCWCGASLPFGPNARMRVDWFTASAMHHDGVGAAHPAHRPSETHHDGVGAAHGGELGPAGAVAHQVALLDAELGHLLQVVLQTRARTHHHATNTALPETARIHCDGDMVADRPSLWGSGCWGRTQNLFLLRPGRDALDEGSPGRWSRAPACRAGPPAAWYPRGAWPGTARRPPAAAPPRGACAMRVLACMRLGLRTTSGHYSALSLCTLSLVHCARFTTRDTSAPMTLMQSP